jgi:Enoyl-CoA hydratase/carnithine racemase
MTAPVLRADRGVIAELTLNRPHVANALSSEALELLLDHLEHIAGNAGTAVVILSGAGDRAFCAGHDLHECADLVQAGGYRRVAELSNALSSKLMALPQPVIAKVRGVASGAGLHLAASCDLIYAADTARFATPGVHVGLWCLKGMVPLSRAVGSKRAFQMLLEGKLHDAEFAARIGLVNEVVPAADLDRVVEDLARRVAGCSSETIAIGKAAFYRQLDMSVPDAYAYVAEVSARAAATPDAVEGMRAFAGKRRPVWRRRSHG